MHGNVAYCKKHGHDWCKIDHGHEGIMIWEKRECMRCGMEVTMYSFFEVKP